MNLVECLKDIEEGRIQDFIAVDDKFYCNKCISTIDVDTLAIGFEKTTVVVTVQEESSEHLMIEADDASEGKKSLNLKIE